jgi:hypothetical protein
MHIMKSQLFKVNAFSQRRYHPLILLEVVHVETQKLPDMSSMEQIEVKLHWMIAEYFEASLIPSNPDAKVLTKKLRNELTEMVRKQPVAFGR